MMVVVFDHQLPNFNDYISNHKMTNKRSYYTSKEIDKKMYTNTQIICVIDSCSLCACGNSLLLAIGHSVAAGH